MFSLVRDKKGQLKIIEPDEKFHFINDKCIKIVDDSITTILESNNRFCLEFTKNQLLSKVNVELNEGGIENNDQFAVNCTSESGIAIGKEPLSSNSEKKIYSKNSSDQLGEIEWSKSNEDDDNDDSETYSDDDYTSSESELDADSSIDSDDNYQSDSDDNYQSDSNDSLIEELRSNVKSVELPDISVSLVSSEKLDLTSVLSSTSHSESGAIDPDWVPETSNITGNVTNTENADTDIEKQKEEQKQKEKLSIQALNDNIEEHVDNAEPPDYEKVKIEPVKKKSNKSPRKRKMHECVYCGKDQSHLKRHLLRKHKNEPVVQIMKKESANKSGSRKPMKSLLYAGDVKHNSDATKFTGKYRVARNPVVAEKTVSDYATCPNCKAVILEVEFHKHITACASISGRHCRNLKSLGQKFMNNCHARASPKMQKLILSRMRNDKVLRAIKYDPLLIEFGNEICEHLRGNQHKTNICAKLRRLGRLKLSLKVNKFEDVFVSGKSLTVVKSIERLAAYPDDPDCEYLKYPTLAENLATLVKQVARTHSVLCLRNNESEVRKTTLEFLECFENDYRTRLSRMVSESHGKHRREKEIELPSAEDIRKLYNYLSKVRKDNYNLLEEQFSESVYLELLKSTVTSLQVFNSRRPGDVERIYLSEFQKRQQIGTEKTPDFENLPGDIQDLANEFSLIHTRDKWGNNIKLLVPPDVLLCIKKLVELRPKLDISPKNGYLFALPKTPLAEIRHPSAFVLLSRFAVQCGAEKPHLLRSTRIRKNLATKCIELNLTDAELTDLAAYMGHHVDIHKSHYRRNIVTRDIPLFLKFVNKALEIKKSEKTSYSDSDEPEENNSIVESVNNSATNNSIVERSINDTNANENSAINNGTLEDTALQSGKAVLTRSKTVTMKSLKNKSPKEIGKISRPRWSSHEIKIISKEFKDYFNGKIDTVSSDRIRKMMDENPSLFKGRTDKAIRTWINIRKKKM